MRRDHRRNKSTTKEEIQRSAELKAVTFAKGLYSNYSSNEVKESTADFYMKRIHEMIDKEQKIKTHNYELRE